MASGERILALLLLLWISCCSSFTVSESNEHSLVVGNASFYALKLSQGHLGTKSPSSMVYERVHIHGLSRIKNLRKFAHSVLVKVTVRNSSVDLPKAEVCFHRNVSLGIGMCPFKKWEMVSNGSWARFVSPFGEKLLDVRAAGSSSDGFEVSIEEEFSRQCIVYLISGIFMMSLASFLSNSAVFYYGGLMASGIILVILVGFFQCMKYTTKLLPTGPNISLLIYSSIVGFLSFLLYYFHPLWHSFLTEAGIDEAFSYAIGLLLLILVILNGAWLGFWAVRKFILTKDGSVDTKIAQFAVWFLWIFSAVLILQSSMELVLAIEALVFGALFVSSISTRMFGLGLFRRFYRNMRLAKERHRTPNIPGSLAYEDYSDDRIHKFQSFEDLKPKTRVKKFSGSPSTPAYRGSIGADSSQLYVSSFHTTPERRRFSKPEWEKFTRDSTQQAVEGLVSSPDFGRWVSENVDRITVTPPAGSIRTSEQRRKWFIWFKQSGDAV